MRAHVLTLDDWHDGALLDSRWALETISVDAAEQLWLQVHVVEGVDGLIVVGLDLACEWLVRWCFTIFASPASTAALCCLPACSLSLSQCKKDYHSPSGTSSRPLSAMIAVED